MNADLAAACPVDDGLTDSKTAQMAARYVVPEPGSRSVERFSHLRAILRNESMRQSGVEVAPSEKKNPALASIFWLDGEAHRKRRAAIISFFTPKAIATRHMRVMTEAAERLMANFTKKGRGRLDSLSFGMTVAVTAEIVGLTDSNTDRLANRIERFGRAPVLADRGGFWKLIAPLVAYGNALLVYFFDVRPAIAARRLQRKEDVISRLLDEGRSDMEILAECMTFGLAGMTTSREFMVVAAWHLFDNENLRRRFLDGDDADKIAILTEILRLEPVAGMIYRSATEEVIGAGPEAIQPGTRLSLHIRAANLDEVEVGPRPLKLDPDRAKKLKVNGAYMSFGDGVHFCPGWQLALTQTRVFLDRLFRIPGIRLVRPPEITWVPPMLQMYELRNGIIACDCG